MKYIIIAGILIVAGFLIALSFIPIGIEPLTEVYFEEHTKLPKYLFLNKSYNFSFTVHNLEYQDVEYNYSVNAFDVNNALLFKIDDGRFGLLNNESRTIGENFVFKSSFERAKIEVKIIKNLIGEPEFKKKLWWADPNYPMEIELHFWVEEITGPKIIKIPG